MSTGDFFKDNMTLPNIRIQNTGAAQSNVPFTFGQVFAVGDLMPREGLAGKMPDGSLIPLQVDQKTTHGDGSVRHVIISGILPTLAKGATAKFDLVKAARGKIPTTPFPPAQMVAKVRLVIEGETYNAELLPMTYEPWLFGEIACEGFNGAALRSSFGVEHKLLTIRFGVRWYKNGPARIELIVENTKTFAAPARNFTYDVEFEVNGKIVYSKKALTHYHHSRWHAYAWVGAEPAIHVQPDTAYLIASKAVSNYEQIAIPEETIAALAATLSPSQFGPMTIGTTVEYMGMTGGRDDIGPLPNYAVIYLLTGDQRARDVMMANADGSGTWSIHMRDDKTGVPVRTDNEANKLLSTHMNLNWKGPLPVPRFESDDLSSTPYTEDIGHLPSLTYLPYLLTGDHYYLEEQQFWAASNSVGTAPGNNGQGQGLLRWHQIRGQAWALRDLGRTAYITPDGDPLKAYFTKQVANNLDFYTQTYVIGNPNKLGAYDGSGEGSFYAAGSATWQDAFFTWSLGMLNELGFEKAKPVLQWKAKYAVGRLTDPGFCWIMATQYNLAIRPAEGQPVFSTFGEMYRANYGGNTIRDDGGAEKPGPVGKKFIELPCGSREQSDYLSSINGGYGWQIGQMVGYADSYLGYPANHQPALAVSVGVDVPNASESWARFDSRAAKPDYRKNPLWNIIPRTPVTVTPPVTAPVPPVVTPPAKKGKITVASNVNLKKMTKLLVKVFNPVTFELIRAFDNVTANSKGGFVLEDTALIAKTACAYTVIDAKGKALVINLATVV